jgi:hypothetical protein
MEVVDEIELRGPSMSPLTFVAVGKCYREYNRYRLDTFANRIRKRTNGLARISDISGCKFIGILHYN